MVAGLHMKKPSTILLTATCQEPSSKMSRTYSELTVSGDVSELPSA